jgi:GT2 family glycosyltransferase
MTISAIITTRNRRHELQRTLEKLRELEPPPAEILVCADGCTDGTAEMLREEFPDSILLEHESSRGSVFSRDRLVRAASSEIVASFDDDSYPLEKDFFRQVETAFHENPTAAVLSFPEIRNDGAFANPTKSPSSPPHLVAAYANCAAAMRREVYLKSDGFPAFFGHMYEEPDFALQCYSLGWNVRFDPRVSVRHHVSEVQREPMKRHHLNARNELWSVFLRCPFPQIIAVAFFRVARQFQYACREGLSWAVREPVWWWLALVGLGDCLRFRKPIPWPIYYQWMKLARQPVSDHGIRQPSSVA